MTTKERALEIRGKLDGLNEQIRKFREENCEEARKIFQGGANELFDKFPNLKNFSWRQYTPYFNDGDECRFSCYSDDPYINDEEYQEYQFRYESYTKDMDDETKKLLAIFPDLKEFLGLFTEDTYFDLFGDHVKITVSREGIDVSECSHD